MAIDYGWQDDPAVWADIPKSLRDSTSWRFVGFTEIEASSVPDGESGIYLLCTAPVGRRHSSSAVRNDLFSSLFSPIYIGKTLNLRRRFLEHCRRPSHRVGRARRCFGASMTFWFHRRSSEEIDRDETTLIRCFGPPANERPGTIKAIIREPISIGLN